MSISHVCFSSICFRHVCNLYIEKSKKSYLNLEFSLIIMKYETIDRIISEFDKLLEESKIQEMKEGN